MGKTGKWQGRCARVLLGDSILDAAGARCGIAVTGWSLAAAVLWKRVYLTLSVSFQWE